MTPTDHPEAIERTGIDGQGLGMTIYGSVGHLSDPNARSLADEDRQVEYQAQLLDWASRNGWPRFIVKGRATAPGEVCWRPFVEALTLTDLVAALDQIDLEGAP